MVSDRRVDWALFAGTAVFGAGTLASLWHDHGPVLDALDVALGSVACLALWVRRSHPLAALIAFVAASFSPLALFAGLVAVFNVALRVRDRTMLAVAVLLTVVSCVAFPLVNPKATEVFKPALPAFLFGVIAFGAGRFVLARRELVASLHQRAEQLAADQARGFEQAREAERRRIAHEMHDVLAHRLSLLSIHAGALEFRPGAPPAEIAQAATVIRSSAAAALDDLSQVITVLREDTLSDTTAPQPTLADLAGLVEESRAAGMSLDADLRLDDLGAVPGAVGRTAYRVVQEGLTNARKHAPGAPVDLAVTVDPGDRLLITVVSHPAESQPPGSPGSPVAAGSGSGLLGLAERLALVGGRLEHHTDGRGHFVLRADLPISHPAPTPS
jgi:signal transduction histidine kinase